MLSRKHNMRCLHSTSRDPGSITATAAHRGMLQALWRSARLSCLGAWRRVENWGPQARVLQRRMRYHEPDGERFACTARATCATLAGRCFQLLLCSLWLLCFQVLLVAFCCHAFAC
jgi:hypothetical protein